MSELTDTNRRLLVIDDNPSIHADFRKVLAQDNGCQRLAAVERELFGEDQDETVSEIEFQIDFALQGKDGLELVIAAKERDEPYAVAFVDMRMPPGWDGLKTIEEIWKVAPDLQVVICTAYSDNTWQDVFDRLGQKDNLLILKKPFDAIEVSQMAIALTEKWTLTERAKIEQNDLEELVNARTRELQYAAMHDPLTDLPNRTKFHEELQDALLSAERYGHTVALALLDIDYFKTINDTLGHPVGDEVIRRIGERLQSCVRKTDTVARLGGDEFAIIQTPVESPQQVTALAGRIGSKVKEQFSIGNDTVTPNVSIGIAMAPVDGNQPDQLLRNADMALYRAKDDGRGCYRFFEPAMDARMKQRRELEQRIQDAISEDQFEVYYQPLFKTDSKQLCSVEALVRWNDPAHGLVMPGDFIPLAEETGLIVALGDWVLRKACCDAAQMPQQVRVAVNVSAVQVSHAGFLNSIVDALKSSQLDPGRLELEVTETVMLQDSSESLNVMHEIRDMGVRIVMDDFGTGYSSLSFLRSFPFDKLKIDRSFIQDLESALDAQAIVRAVAHIGQCLGMETTAEGIETETQLAKVQEEGYTQFQGFLYGRPVPIKELNRLFFANESNRSGVVASHLKLMPGSLGIVEA